MKKSLTLAALVILTAGTTAQAADIGISQSNQQFSEDAITVKTGDTILFQNADQVTHNIQVINSDGDTNDKGLQKPGETIKQTFDTPGSYKIRCGIHPSMKLKVTVQ